MRTVLFSGSHRQQDYGVIYGFLPKLFGGHAVPQHFGHNISHHGSSSEHRKSATSNARDMVIHKAVASFITAFLGHHDDAGPFAVIFVLRSATRWLRLYG